MKLVIFDLDGTLTRTVGIDEDCFVRSFENSFGIREIDRDWARYEHVTDAAIASEILRHHLHRPPTEQEVTRHRRHFLELLAQEQVADPGSYGEVPGARELLRRLRASTSWSLAIATGSWREAARFKLAAAEIDADAIPLAAAEDGPSRTEIVAAALARAGLAPLEKVVLVGDAVWDVDTARALGLSFIGVAAGERAAALRNAGAADVVRDLRDAASFIDAIERAQPPHTAETRP